MNYVLVVDDDKDFARATSMTLRSAGYEVSVELDIESAKKSMHERKPDLVVLDVMFPESDTAGFELAQEMRHFDETFKSIPILMLTAVNQEFSIGFSSSDINEYWLHVDEFLEKPIDLDLLCKKVSDMLSREKSGA